MTRKILLLLALSTLVLAGEVKIIFIGEPGADVYVNMAFVGQIGSNGRLSLNFQLGNMFYVSTDGNWYIQVGEPQVVKVGDNTVVFLNLVKASRVRVLSNVYPISIFVDGEYYGKLRSPSETIKVPSGYREVTFKAEGYRELSEKFPLEWEKVESIPVELKRLPKVLKIYLSSDEFSPNGDWYKDVLEVHIYSTFESTATLTISGNRGTILRKELLVREGDNIVKWYGNGAEDGIYEVSVTAEGITSSAKVKIDRSNYTYRKEISIAMLLMLLAATIAAVYFSSR